MQPPFSQAAENNQGPILEVIQGLFSPLERVLEVGSGTGQHAVYFARNMPTLFWQTSDRPENHGAINSWLDRAGLPNLGRPLALDVNETWSIEPVPAVFSANTLHIMSWLEVENFFTKLAEIILPKGLLCVYGPFNYQGHYTSDSNARFDAWLHEQNPASAIRDFEKVNELAIKSGLYLQSDTAMPANNRLLHWQKT